MKIIQISTVVEPTYVVEELFWRDEATIYGLGEDNKMYYWGRTGSNKISHDPDEEGDTESWVYSYGWKPYSP